MAKEYGQQVKELYTACSELLEADQARFISKSNYPLAVKQKVVDLLNYSGDIDENLSQVILESAKQGLNISSIQANEKIEQYQLVERIGEGGQGEVWLAKRIGGDFNHKVAIKFIKLSPNGKELQRFQNERELLASLQHGNIASLIGGGQYQDRLYMIMEWVQGIALMDYVQNKALNLNQTLNCFKQICQAVSYAHSKGIIHRDIKPSNILVTNDRTIKLLDFGIAKTIDAESTLTQSAAMMTLAYSSPEQINGASVTTATDVYALGLLLYELLSAHRAQENTTESTADYIHQITDITPCKPSELAKQQLARFPEKHIKGDLDNLVMMAIRKEPERRYKSVDALITDIENYQQSLPLLASGDSLGYKISKLLKRNPLASAAIAVVVLFLILLPLVMYQNGLKLKKERDIAQKNALIANKTSQFLTTLFESASPLGSHGKSIDLNSVLAQGERQLMQDVGTQPQVTAQLSMTMAQIHYHLGHTEKAIEYYKNAVKLFNSVKDKAGEVNALGQLAVMYYRHDELDKSDETFQTADTVASQINDPIQLAWHLIRKATIANETGKTEEAIQLAEKALDIAQSDQHKNLSLYGRIYSELGEAYKFNDKEKSLELNKKSLDYAELEFGKIHPFYLSRLSSKAVRLMRLNRYEEAKSVIDETIAIAEKLYSKNHPNYANFLSSKSTYLHDKGYFNQAEMLYKQMLEIYRNSYGENSYDYARILNNLAYLYEDKGELNQARKLYKQSVELRKKLDPNNQIRIATSQANLARVLSKLGLYKQSNEILKPVIPIFELNNRNNVYNKITQMSNQFAGGRDEENCKNGLKILNKLSPEIKQQTPNWKRLGAEIWIVGLLKSCQYKNEALHWKQSAKQISKNIYEADSQGYKILLEHLQ